MCLLCSSTITRGFKTSMSFSLVLLSWLWN
ncbi:hypothetical protein Pint_25681 [Pistacia integerrima]|uniref:Uncharacterized protein n=1 Tax=Pistacia integerrima TaxID=434235 RepID=A0ACC0YF28_9ROSI|nr:hypothetical protein Pint_25681 [Pistacia integerrima]